MPSGCGSRKKYYCIKLCFYSNSDGNHFKFLKKWHYKVALPNNMYFSKKCLKLKQKIAPIRKKTTLNLKNSNGTYSYCIPIQGFFLFQSKW